MVTTLQQERTKDEMLADLSCKPPAPQVNVEATPEEMRAVCNWLGWSWEKRSEKWSKIPKQPSGRNAASNRPNTWSTFGAVVASYEKGKLDGVGFVFSDDWSGVDLDKCRNPATGALDQWARDIVDALASYTEVSPTGTGVKVFTRGELPPGGNKRGNVEMYDKSSPRFFTVTGAHLEGTPRTVEERTAELARVHAEHIAPPASANGNGRDHASVTTPTVAAGTRGWQSVEVFFRPDAEPPGKLSVALVNDHSLNLVWQKKGRPPKNDASQSGWDLKLAGALREGGFTDQEIADTLVAYRRIHHQDVKRLDYYQRTIWQMRGEDEQEQEEARLEEEISSGVIEQDPEARARALRELGEAVVGCPLTNVVQDGDEESEITMSFEGKEPVAISTRSLFDHHTMLVRLSEKHVGRLRPKYKAWDRFAHMIVQSAVRVEGSTIDEQVEIAVQSFIKMYTPPEKEKGDTPLKERLWRLRLFRYEEAHRRGYGLEEVFGTECGRKTIRHEGRVAFEWRAVQVHMAQNEWFLGNRRPGANQVRAALRRLCGERTRQLDAVHPITEKRTQVTVYMLPIGFDDGEE